MIHLLRGTPYVYQGEEIGMTNVLFEDFSDYKDLSMKSRSAAMVATGKSWQSIKAELCPLSRDNSRTPYQWNACEHGGFTTGTPWLKVNPRYSEINLEKDRKSKDSVFAWYQRLIAMRREEPAILDGLFEMLLPEHSQIVMYQRRCTRQTLLVVANFGDTPMELEKTEQLLEHSWRRLMSNYHESEPSLETGHLCPWQAELYERIN